MAKKKFYDKGIPGINPGQLSGTLIVLEGCDGSGRSTQSFLLKQWLERLGYPTVEVGLKRSTLVGRELEEVMQGNLLTPITFSLFYATDFADQLEKNIIPSLRAGFVVIADRYIYTLMARDVVRGLEREWVKNVYGMALVPDLVCYLEVPPKILAERCFQKSGVLNYWESGMDIQSSGDMYQCFVNYQNKLNKEFSSLNSIYKFSTVDGNRDPMLIAEELQGVVKKVLKPSALKGQAKRASR